MEKSLKIVAPAGYEIDEEKSTFETIIFKPINSRPKTWESLEFISGYYISTYSAIMDVTGENRANLDNRNIFPEKEEAEACLALAQLLQLRKAWIGNWVPNWGMDNKQGNYCIIFEEDKPVEYYYLKVRRALSFPTKEMAKEFIKTFEDLIIQAKPLL